MQSRFLNSIDNSQINLQTPSACLSNSTCLNHDSNTSLNQQSNTAFSNTRMHNNLTRLWLEQHNRAEQQRRNQMIRR